MGDLNNRFGKLVAAHRRRQGLTQEKLAEAATLTVDMISKIETGSSGVRFPTIERLAEALKVDPAELFSPEVPSGAAERKVLVDITAMLAGLNDGDLVWVKGILVAALKTPKRLSSNPRNR